MKKRRFFLLADFDIFIDFFVLNIQSKMTGNTFCHMTSYDSKEEVITPAQFGVFYKNNFLELP